MGLDSFLQGAGAAYCLPSFEKVGDGREFHNDPAIST